MTPNLAGLVDLENELVSRRIFSEPEIYRQELERIFARCWRFLCHESQIPRPGDFLTTDMGEDPILGNSPPKMRAATLTMSGGRTFRPLRSAAITARRPRRPPVPLCRLAMSMP